MKKKSVILKLDKMIVSRLNDTANSKINGGGFFSGAAYCSGPGGWGSHPTEVSCGQVEVSETIFCALR